MSSMGAYTGYAMGTCYTGSKGFLETAVPTLGLEVAQFNIRVCLLTPGYFRTTVFAPGNVHFRAPSSVPDYDELRKTVEGVVRAGDGTLPGDPRKGARLIVDAVRGEGDCVGKTLPLRLPLGDDGFQVVRESCEDKLRICDEWEEIMSKTRLDDVEQDH